MKFIPSVLFLALLATAQDGITLRPLGSPQPNTILGEPFVAKAAAKERTALVGTHDQVFPHIAIGSGWETVMVIANLSPVPVNYTQLFFGTDGNPMPVTFRTYPEGRIVTDSGIIGTLPPFASFNFALFDNGQPLQTGWSNLTYDTAGARLGAYAVFRLKVPSRPIYEALVPLSAYDDTRFFMPYDNMEGFDTGIALVNPASNLPNRVRIQFLNMSGLITFEDTVTLPPGGQTAFSLTTRYPQLAGRVGTLYVESSTTRLSALGIRFNNAGGGAFSTVPIMNYSAMFQ